MTGSQKIQIALENKGYKLMEAYFEPISYGPTGREGGWYVQIEDNEEDEDFPDWSKITLPNGLIGDVMHTIFVCYNLKDAMQIIKLLPEYKSFNITLD